MNTIEPFIPGTVKPESDYEEFSRLGAKLGLPCPQAHISLESRDADGNLVSRFEDRSRTLNRNYWTWLFRSFALFNVNSSANASLALAADTTFGAGHITLKTTAGTVVNANLTVVFSSPAINGAVGTLTGIVAGTGTGAESFDGFALDAIINQGVAAGTFSYQAEAMPVPSYNAGTLTWTASPSRIMNNNSGGDITVGEVGIYANYSNGGGPHMIMRDKLASTVLVLNGGQLTVTYTFTLTFPA